MATPTRLVLIRHGESQVTVDRVIGGFRTCSGLSALGRRQTERLRERLVATGELAGAVLLTSSFPRAIETAEAIAAAVVPAGSPTPDPVAIDAGFGEHDPGPDLDGVSFADYVARYGSPQEGAEVFPGGETMAAFRDRVETAIETALARHPGRLIVVVCHGGVIDVAFRRLLRLPATGAFDLWTLNTSITEFHAPRGRPDHEEPRWRLVRYNDAAHLTGLPEATER